MLYPFNPLTKCRRQCRSRNRRGTVAVLVSVVLVVLLGMTALALDGGLLQHSKRRVQGAADAAALAAATTLFRHYPSITPANADPGGNAARAALTSAYNNGYANNGTNSSVTVHIPPASGPFSGQISYAEVIVTYYQPRYFSTVYGSQRMPVTARAVARGFWGGTGKGVIVLDPTAQYALDASGNGSVTLTGGANMVVDSNNSAAARATGGGSLTAPKFEVNGGTVGTFNGTVETGVPPIADPLAYLPAPTMPSDGTMTKTNIGAGNKRYVLSPGRYSTLPNFNVGDEVILQQASAGNGGIFYIDGGGFNSTGANITMDSSTSGGVMIYNNPVNSSASQGIQIQGNSAGNVNLSALTSSPYAGILFFQNRTAAETMSVSGNGSFNLSGTFYVANALLSVTGNGTATIGSQYISRLLNLSGGGAVTINYSDNGTAKKRAVLLVE